MHPDRVLIKTCMDREMLRQSKFPEPGKAYSDLVLQATPLGAKRHPCVASVFLGKCASITAVDLIKRKKLDSWKF